MTAAVPEGRFVIDGPTADSAVVQVWANDYIRFESLPAWQKHVRDEIRSRSRQLEPEAGQVLHATFCGAKLPNADVENLVIYNIDTFRVAGRNGIRFEYGDLVPPAPQVEYWPHLTGPTWVRSRPRSNWLRCGGRCGAEKPRPSSRRLRRTHLSASELRFGYPIIGSPSRCGAVG